MTDDTRVMPGREWLVEGFLVLATVGLALAGARDYAACWNDGSRLAMVEALVDHHTLAIDNSIYVKVPPPRPDTPPPYRGDVEAATNGTGDKMFIRGHFYSDKSPVPGFLMAGWYRAWQRWTGSTARNRPDAFCRAMTWTSSGLAYVVAVLCIYRLGRVLRLAPAWRLALAGSFGLSTVALPYAWQVNSHILLLAVSAALTLGLARLCLAHLGERLDLGHLARLGGLAGLGYTMDLGTGPVLLFGTGLLVLARGRLRGVVMFACGALPWLLLHHALNYQVGGTLRPANAVAEYFRYPGSAFDTANLTGRFLHAGPGHFLLYAASMLFGKRGFLGHNLPLFLALPAAVILLRRHGRHWPIVLWAVGCCVGTWLLYAATSNNSSGRCCSIRWFVPLLAPAYLVLGLWLRLPRQRQAFLVLSAWGALLMLLNREAAWAQHMIPFFWPIQALALVSWALSHRKSYEIRVMSYEWKNAESAVGTHNS
jgi:hypothetical protein